MDRDELLKQLTMLDFVATDLALYLDTHGDDKKVIEQYNAVLEEADALRYDYEKNYGPLCSYRSMSNPDDFKWIQNPWPWQRCFNFKL